MKATPSVVLALLLVALPVKQVLAQAVQQETVRTQQVVPGGRAAHVLRAQLLSENAARLMRTPPPLDPLIADAPLAQENPDESWFQRQSFGVKLLLVVAATGLGILLVYLSY